MNWDAYVRDKVKTYQQSELCRRDVINALSYYKDLKPVQRKFVHNDGKQVDLLALEGTIPIKYKGVTYNIPIIIWVMETFPFVPPLVYVQPTNTMAIKVSKHVDANGRVFLPFLHEWNHPRSDLAALLQILTCVFAEEPPVYAKTPQFPSQPPAQYHAASRPGYPGYPPSQSTPYPAGGSAGMPMPQMPVPGGMSSTNPPPYPSYPTATSSNTPYPSRPPVPYPPVSSAYQQPVSQMPVQSSPVGTDPRQSRPFSTQSTLSEETIKASLMSAVDDKLRRRLKETYDYAQHEMKELEKTEEALKKGREKLDDMLTKLEKEQADVDNNIKLLTEKNEEIAAVVSKLEDQTESLQIDEAVVTTAPLYNQILNLFAEENALEDTIYYLSEGLRKDAIDLESFLKHIRTLSRKQFMTRALLYKARKTAGLKDMAGL